MRTAVLATVLCVFFGLAGCGGDDRTGGEVCGNGTCAAASGENCTSCVTDCGVCATCGNGTCSPATETCSSCPGDCGSCGTTCGPTSCAGCCDGDVCAGGNAPSACGAGGDTCMVCAPSFICGAGACTVDPASRWNVFVDGVDVPTTDLAGAAWDSFGGAPDPYVEVRIGSETATPTRTTEGVDVFTVTFPTAAATNVRADDLQAVLRFDALDADVDAPDFIGACQYVGLPDAVFIGGEFQDLSCAADPATSSAGFTALWHLERF